MSNVEPRCTLSPDCELGPHAPDAHPCGKRCEQPGEPCRYCGDPVRADADGQPVPCPRCWIPIPANLADAKALLALGGLSVDLAEGGAMTAVRVVAAGRLRPRRRPEPEPAVEPAAVVELARPERDDTDTTTTCAWAVVAVIALLAFVALVCTGWALVL